MGWKDLSRDEQEAEIRSVGRSFPSGSAGWELFGQRWDEAEVTGAAHGLAPAEVIAAQRFGVPLAEWAATSRVTNVREYRAAEQELQVTARAAAEARLELERDRAKARIGSGT